MTAIAFIVFWLLMTLITAIVFYVIEARGENGRKYGGYAWADDFIGFHIVAGLAWPLTFPCVAMALLVRTIARKFIK